MSDANNQTLSPLALFRFLLVSRVLALVHGGQCLAQAITMVAALMHMRPEGSFKKVSVRSLYRWVQAYKLEGLAGLDRKKSPPKTGSSVISDCLLSFADEQKGLDVCVSIPDIIERARELGIIKPHQAVDRTTLYRNMRASGIPVKRRKTPAVRDSRRFAYIHRMQMILCDGKHFRAGASRKKRVALFFLDDASRYGLDVIVGASENTSLFLKGLHSVIAQYGFFGIIFMDHGPGFRSKDTAAVVANLGGLLIHGADAYPQGHGKIERFNQTALSKVLRSLDRRPDVDPDCGALTLRLRHWLKQRYNHTPHESLV